MQNLLEGDCVKIRGRWSTVVELEAAADARVACEYEVW
jgi:hypothetical protein